jgi:hypothetical protein
MVYDFRSGWSCGIGPSGRARRVLLIGRVLLEEPAGEEGDMPDVAERSEAKKREGVEKGENEGKTRYSRRY